MAATRAQHPDITQPTLNALKTVRDSIEGSVAIKALQALYLEPPSMVNPNSPEQMQRYRRYLMGAEYDGTPDATRRAWLGKMRIDTAAITVPDRLDYLMQDADGDGTGLASAIEHAASEVFQAKWHILVADYQGLSGVDTTALSKADVEALKPRATIKQYTRESLRNWSFGRINGKLQLTYMELYEQAREFNVNTGQHDEVDVYLILALDEDGNYYQQKVVDGAVGERSYMTVGGAGLKWLPVEFASDEELKPGSLPKQPGALYPICETELHKYRVSADYKESLAQLVATLITMGWSVGDYDEFKKLNGGRENLQLGGLAANNLPEGVTYDILNSSPALEGFERYATNANEKLKQQGGSVKTRSEGQRTATEADIDASELNAMLSTVASNLEDAFRRIVLYCGMFEGLYSQDVIEQNLEAVTIDLPREFAKPKLSVEEVRGILELYREGIYTKKHVVQRMTEGGWGTGAEIDTWLTELEEEMPSVSSMADILSRVQPERDDANE